MIDYKRGDVVIIEYEDKEISKNKNKILITYVVETKQGKQPLAVWYDDEDLKGRPYQISKNQIITEILERNIDVDKYIDEAEKIRNAKLYELEKRRYE